MTIDDHYEMIIIYPFFLSLFFLGLIKLDWQTVWCTLCWFNGMYCSLSFIIILYCHYYMHKNFYFCTIYFISLFTSLDFIVYLSTTTNIDHLTRNIFSTVTPLRSFIMINIIILSFASFLNNYSDFKI